MRRLFAFFFALLTAAASAGDAPANGVNFARDIQPLFAKHCYSCHGPEKQRGGYRLDRKSFAFKTGEEKPIVPGKSAASSLISRIQSDDDEEKMPPKGERLSAAQVALLKTWIDSGAVWPDDATNAMDGWALKPLNKPAEPQLSPEQKTGVKTPIDVYVRAMLAVNKLTPAPEADKRTLLRRVYFDLIGLPPTPTELDAFLADTASDAYERVVDRLLASPRYGERWARHWMDAVHFAETHGHDQDRIRPNAWPYRDYLIDSFNRDTPYARFIQEQLAADVLFPDEPRLIPALGFIAAGPWDESTLRDIREDSICRQVGYYLDRDDMVAQTMSVFTSSTVHCARCHDHKFDPISQQDYYSLQAVFAGIGRADRSFDPDPAVHRKRRELRQILNSLERNDVVVIDALLTPEKRQKITSWADSQRASLTAEIAWEPLSISKFESRDGTTLVPQPDGSLLATIARPDMDIYVLRASTSLKTISAIRLDLIPDPSLPQNGPGREDNGNMHLSEIVIQAHDKAGAARTLSISGARADFNQKDWSVEQAIDAKRETAWAIFPEVGKPHHAIFALKDILQTTPDATLTITLEQVQGGKRLIGRFKLSATSTPNPLQRPTLPQDITNIVLKPAAGWSPDEWRTIARNFLKDELTREQAAMPPPQWVYAAAADFKADGSHKPIAVPRPVHLLKRGDIAKPQDLIPAGALTAISTLPARFALADDKNEGLRRAALAAWISDAKNPLTWRSIANRIWHFHFGRGLSPSLNDFGKMGQVPSHPELLDFLATTLRDEGGSLKKLSRMIVTSAVYKQSAQHDAKNAQLDSENHFLWRMNRSRLDAESFRDAILQISGRLDLQMGGPSVKNFTLGPAIHVTPLVEYTTYDWNAPGANRRSVYRFLFRTLPDPFMDALDCADSSQLTEKRSTSVTPLQALALMNNTFMFRYSEHLAKHLEAAGPSSAERATALCRTVYLRAPKNDEVVKMSAFAERHGWSNLCRMVLNSSEFLFVD